MNIINQIANLALILLDAGFHPILITIIITVLAYLIVTFVIKIACTFFYFILNLYTKRLIKQTIRKLVYVKKWTDDAIQVCLDEKTPDKVPEIVMAYVGSICNVLDRVTHSNDSSYIVNEIIPVEEEEENGGTSKGTSD